MVVSNQPERRSSNEGRQRYPRSGVGESAASAAPELADHVQAVTFDVDTGRWT
ncbi:hypothetical protein [Streptomyces chryseus]|uniref:hypothetical protein n=1 Tax=Streptomyces chryseus TaxID=68186 RepID=UPI00142EF2F1|nr:hypothetical protein [Streptomyces chryseus]